MITYTPYPYAGLPIGASSLFLRRILTLMEKMEWSGKLHEDEEPFSARCWECDEHAYVSQVIDKIRGKHAPECELNEMINTLRSLTSDYPVTP